MFRFSLKKSLRTSSNPTVVIMGPWSWVQAPPRVYTRVAQLVERVNKKLFSVGNPPIYSIYREVSIGMRLRLISTGNGVQLSASPPKRIERFFLVQLSP